MLGLPSLKLRFLLEQLSVGDGTSKDGVPNMTEILGPGQLLDGFKQNMMPAGYSHFAIDGGWGLPTAVDELGRAVTSTVSYPDLQNGSFA